MATGVSPVLSQTSDDAGLVGVEAVGKGEVALGIQELALGVEHYGQVVVGLGQLGVDSEGRAQDRLSTDVVAAEMEIYRPAKLRQEIAGRNAGSLGIGLRLGP